MTAGTNAAGRAQIGARTLRTDRWWLQPALTVAALVAFIIYSTIRAFANTAYYAPPYISPFYSPCLTTNCVPGAGDVNLVGDWWQLSPALIILIFPLGFRLTCYYYRKAYYRGFWASPPACAVAEPHGKYTGESRFPLVLNNIHRYFFYAGLVFNVILTYDVVLGFRDAQGNWGHAGLGTLVLLLNAAFLWVYSLSCHSCRHLIGGRLTHFSRHPLRYRMWTWLSKLNAQHMRYAWISLFWVAFTDFYVMLVASNTISDLRFF
ncbi:hypothetical protein F0L68_29075 [Solihabitans fulvus]|uniref:Uncharacterized protein n=1 Tax=Solihabitans fulvus TaxID=1892852 RepID=A0A5B2WUX5_9PSEU|nr:hypothetical protein [Solihabitans fulvus]KAA2254838.1 hypothetical protein F0L68_29075 [Solihabitans fulvus]